MSPFRIAKEHAELERQGAKAAARGDGAMTNPMLNRWNLPFITGEGSEDWCARRDAWQSGFDAPVK